jgi:hypothetical protein
MVKRALLPLLLPALLFLALAWPASARPRPFIDIVLETHEAFLGDTVVIEVRWSGLDDPIDFSPLRHAAAIVGETAGTRIAVIEGEVVEIASRRIELVPQAVGRLVLGPLSAGAITSNSVSLQITETRQKEWTPGPDDIRIEQTVSRPDPWLQQLVVLDIALLTRHPIRDETVTLPDLAGLRTVTVYKERRTLEAADGGWSKIAWRTLVFPQHSGRIAIAGARVSGAIDKSRAERARFDLAAPATDLAVRPAAFPGTEWWIAASRLTLSDSWSREPRELRAGDEVERTITVTALDVLPEQIPDPAMDETRGLAIIPLDVERTMKLAGDHVEAQATRRFRIRAMSPVPVFLDTVRLRWWNSVEDRPAEAIIPARRIDIGIPDRANLMEHALADTPWWRRLDAWTGPAANLLSILSVVVIAVLALGGAMLWRRRTSLSAWFEARRDDHALKRLAKVGDTKGFYHLLRRLAVGRNRRDALLPLLKNLETALFGNGRAPDLEALARQAGHALRKARRRPVASVLPPL